MGVRGRTCHLTTGVALCATMLNMMMSTQAIARANFTDERNARDALANKLLKLSQSLDMKESKYPESGGGGAQDFNRNDGNSFTSNTTYHSYVYHYCLRWIGPRYCEKWLPPYVSLHGAHGDKSPLEGAVYTAWKEMGDGGEKQNGDATEFGIWTFKKNGNGSILDGDGKIDTRAVTRWDLKPQVKERVEQEGYNVANRTMTLTFDENSGKEPNTMPNMESLRYMASRWTKMMRNRLVSNLGELRAVDTPIEFALGEDKAKCEDYVRALQSQERDPIEERIRPQNNLDPETRAKAIQERLAMCEQMLKASVAMVNPQIRGNQVRAGDPDAERVDHWRTRLNIAAIDAGGINPNELAKPANVQLEKAEYSQLLADWEVGGRNMRPVVATNAEQLESYNAALDSAAVGMKEVAKRSPQIVDTSAEIVKNKIAMGSRNLVELNGLTREMKGELSDTALPRIRDTANNPETNLERSRSELTVKAAR